MPLPKQYETAADRQRAYRLRQRQAIAQVAESKGLPAPANLATMPSRRRWTASVATARQLLETVISEIDSYIDDRSEQWQESDAATELEAFRDALSDSIDSLPDD